MARQLKPKYYLVTYDKRPNRQVMSYSEYTAFQKLAIHHTVITISADMAHFIANSDWE